MPSSTTRSATLTALLALAIGGLAAASPLLRSTVDQGNSSSRVSVGSGIAQVGNNNHVLTRITEGSSHSSPAPIHRGGYGSKYLADATLPDGTALRPGQRVTKAWRVENVGHRTWVGLTLRRVSAREASTVDGVPVPTTRPGQKTVIHVPLRMPLNAGHVYERWALFLGHTRLFKPGTELYFSLSVR